MLEDCYFGWRKTMTRFEHVEIEVPLSHSRGNCQVGRKIFGPQKKYIGWSYKNFKYYLSIDSKRTCG